MQIIRNSKSQVNLTMGKNMKMLLEISVRLRYLHQGKGGKICEGTFKIEYLPARKKNLCIQYRATVV